MLLTSEEEFEIFMTVLYPLEFLFQCCQPRGNQMQIFKTNPLPLLSRSSHHNQSSLILPTTHRQLQIILPPHLSLTILLQLLRRIITRRYYKQSRNLTRTLFFCHLPDRHVGTTYTRHSEDIAHHVYKCKL